MRPTFACALCVHPPCTEGAREGSMWLGVTGTFPCRRGASRHLRLSPIALIGTAESPHSSRGDAPRHFCARPLHAYRKAWHSGRCARALRKGLGGQSRMLALNHALQTCSRASFERLALVVPI
eukprot:1203970-Pleurochrysis_carterae.AAC.4